VLSANPRHPPDYPDAETNMFVLMDDAGKVARSFSARCADSEWSERGLKLRPTSKPAARRRRTAFSRAQFGKEAALLSVKLMLSCVHFL